jgi:hypothetical protein
LHALLVAPVVVLFLAPDIAVYSSYAACLGMTDRDQISFHGFLALACVLSIVAGGALVLVERRPLATIAYVLPFVFASAWLQGKRAVVLLVCLIGVLDLWQRRVLRGTRLVMASLAALALFGFYSYEYQTRIRQVGATEGNADYERTRLDYGRDHGIKLAIFAELNPQVVRILDYRGESLLFDVTMFVPRKAWPTKPWPYAVYATSASLFIHPRDIGWGLATSWLEEAIANFGWFGLLAGPLLLGLICRVGDAAQDAMSKALTVTVSCLLLVVQAPAFIGFPVLWAYITWRARRRAKRVVRLPSHFFRRRISEARPC